MIMKNLFFLPNATNQNHLANLNLCKLHKIVESQMISTWRSLLFPFLRFLTPPVLAGSCTPRERRSGGISGSVGAPELGKR